MWDTAICSFENRPSAARETLFGNQLQFSRVYTGVLVAEWLRAAGVSPRYQWWPTWSRPRMDILSSCFGYLGLQIATALSGTATLHTCDGCGEAYYPRRKPRTDRRSFCQDCRDDHLPGRLHVREHRERQRTRAEAQQAAAEGKAGGQRAVHSQ